MSVYNKEEIIKKLQDETLQLLQKPITDKTSVCWNNFKVFISIYTGCPILNNTRKYLRNGGLNKKMFQTKVVWLEGSHQMVAII